MSARIEQEAERINYQIYVTDTLRAITQLCSRAVIGQAVECERFVDFLQGIQQSQPEDGRTGEEIAADVIRRCGLKVVRA